MPDVPDPSNLPPCRAGVSAEELTREADRAVLYGAVLAAQRSGVRLKPHIAQAAMALLPAVRAFLAGEDSDDAAYALEYARACGAERVQWMDLAAALLSARGRQVSVKNDRLHIRPESPQGLGKCDTADPAFSFMKTCDPWVQNPNAASEWVLPPGFAPVHEVGARFIELPPEAVVERPPQQQPPAEPAIEFQSPAPDSPMLPAGTEVTVLGYRSRDGSFTANGASVTLPDGSTLNVTSTGIGAPSAE